MALPEQMNPYNIQLSPDQTPGQTHVEGLTQESADRASELLVVNHVRYHTLFDRVGFHNHNVHHLLTLWAMGASPDQIQTMYDLNKGYQALIEYRPASVSVQLKQEDFFRGCIGKPEYYEDFVRFFQDEIAQKGVPSVVNRYVFKGDDLADDILCRMHSGFLHPMIHLGCALEFHQPCLVAEALAAACIHDDWPRMFLLPTERYIQRNPQPTFKTQLQVINELRCDDIITNAVKPTDPINKISDGLLARASERLVPYLASYQVRPDEEELEKQTRDMMHTCAYMVGAAQHPGKVESIDFVMMHTLTLSAFYPTFMQQSWISTTAKKRLLQWKVWSDAVVYAGVGSPQLYPERVTGYQPKRPQDGWPELVQRAIAYDDDGHTSKVIRGLMAVEQLPPPTEGFPLRKEDLVGIAHLTLDSVERINEPGGCKVPDRIRKDVGEEMGQDEEILRVMVRFVRWCGLEGAWDNFPDLKKHN